MRCALASYVVAVETGTPRAQVAIGLGSFEELIMPLLDEPLRAHGCDRLAAGGVLRARDRAAVTPAPGRNDEFRAGSGSALLTAPPTEGRSWPLA